MLIDPQGQKIDPAWLKPPAVATKPATFFLSMIPKKLFQTKEFSSKIGSVYSEIKSLKINTRDIKVQLLIVSYYKQLSANMKMYNYKIKTSFVSPMMPKARPRTGFDPENIDRVLSHTGKLVLQSYGNILITGMSQL